MLDASKVENQMTAKATIFVSYKNWIRIREELFFATGREIYIKKMVYRQLFIECDIRSTKTLKQVYNS